MKKILLAVLAAVSFSAFSQVKERSKEVTSDIDQVHVFVSGAQVKRTAKVELEKGITKLVLTGISPQIDPSSIQVSADGDVVILSVSNQANVLANPKKMPIIQMMEDTLVRLRYQLEEEKNTRFVLEQEQSLLLTNKELGGEKGVSVVDLEDALELYRTKLPKIRRELLESASREKKIEERIKKQELQLDEFKRSNQQPTHEVLVVVSVASNKRVTVDLGYYVAGAGWNPVYDIRAKDLSNPAELTYKAIVTNNSGENWENVKMVLSTGNPNLSGEMPLLYPNYLNLLQVQTYDRKVSSKQRYAPAVKAESMVLDQVISYEANVKNNTAAVEFELPVVVNVLANNQPQTVDINKFQLAGVYHHLTVPKLDKDAFILANITGWEELNLLSGSANVYFEGTFVGQTFLDANITQDTLRVSLGRDKRVVVTREKLKDFSSKNISGSKVKELFTYEITVRNTKKEAIRLTIEDQVPVSQNDDISVDMKENSEAAYDKTSGKLTWQKSIEPGATEKIRVSFEIKYPKDRIISGL